MSPPWSGLIWRRPASRSTSGGSPPPPCRRQPPIPRSASGPDGAVIAITSAPDGRLGSPVHRLVDTTAPGAFGRTATHADQSDAAALEPLGVVGAAAAPTPQLPE